MAETKVIVLSVKGLVNRFFSGSFAGGFLSNSLWRLTHKAIIENSINEISMFTGEPTDEVKRKYCNIHLPSQSWEAANPKTEKEILQFYSETTALIYGLARWNNTNPEKFRSRFKLLNFCQSHNIKSVLDYGGGIGDYCILLAQNRIEVTYADVLGKTWQFSKWRFERRNLPITMLRAGIDPLSRYDLVVCTDVLPFVTNPPSLANQLVAALRPMGYLAAVYNFREKRALCLDNSKYADTFDSYLRRIGLEFLVRDFFLFFQKQQAGSTRSID
jgi:2-polyprenyl-3-methyl-5-hydroxy-6-metoxy-1,4-benzoquinol methylase